MPTPVIKSFGIEQFLKAEWNRSLKTEMLAGDRMGKTEHVCMQTKTAHRVLIATILAVTHYGMSKVGHMDANLVLSACFEFAFNERIAIRRSQNIIMCHCIFATIIHWT